ncbi:MAG: hypothetical protein J7M05_12005, partial [Anaerolineae bacterium]|nr:hypothetical protein [Anaerolineae bacterium]
GLYLCVGADAFVLLAVVAIVLPGGKVLLGNLLQDVGQFLFGPLEVPPLNSFPLTNPPPHIMIEKPNSYT